MKLKKIIFYFFIFIYCSSFGEKSKINIDFQNINGKAGEYSYNKPGDGTNISFLEWKIKNIPLIKIGYEYQNKNFEFLIEARKNINNNIKSHKMKNYDWLPSDIDDETAAEILYIADFFDLETAENERKENEKIIDNQDGTYTLYYFPTSKDTGTLFSYSESKNYVKDILGFNLSLKYYLINMNNFKLAPIAGIKYDKFSFFAKGINGYNYIPGREYFYFQRNIDNKVIKYEQEFITPYIGIYSSYSPNDLWNFIFEVKGSNIGKAKAKDRHILRNNMLISEKYNNINSIFVKLGITYSINNFFLLKSEVEFSKYFKNQKSRVKISDDYISEIKPKGSSGISNENIIYSLGFEYKL